MSQTDYSDGDFDAYAEDAPVVRSAFVQRVVNVAGGVTSVALVAGLAFWGYQVAMRDVTGIPVVRALEGPMRVAPEVPGGDVAAHQGLSVNAIAAVGSAPPPADRLVLAPRPVDLSLEDGAGLSAPVSVVAAAPVPEAEVDPADLAMAAPEAEGEVPGAVFAAAAAAPEPEPLPAPAALPQTMEEATALALAEALAGMDLDLAALDSVPGVTLASAMAAPSGALISSPRPMARPGTPVAFATMQEMPAGALPVREVDAAILPVGTRLVQLGAFDDQAAARAEWDNLGRTFADLLEGKARVVQPAQSGGRTFYRLRAEGFADEADARRFCSALLSENAACIPVTLR